MYVLDSISCCCDNNRVPYDGQTGPNYDEDTPFVVAIADPRNEDTPAASHSLRRHGIELCFQRRPAKSTQNCW